MASIKLSAKRGTLKASADPRGGDAVTLTFGSTFGQDDVTVEFRKISDLSALMNSLVSAIVVLQQSKADALANEPGDDEGEDEDDEDDAGVTAAGSAPMKA